MNLITDNAVVKHELSCNKLASEVVELDIC